MNIPTPGLRRFVNDSNQIAKLDLRVAAGAEIAVDDDTARQLPSQFKDPDVVAVRDAARRALNPDPEVEEAPKKKAKKDPAE